MSALLDIDGCKIGDEGCRYLAKGQWDGLEKLIIGKNMLIKQIIRLHKKGVTIFQKRNGKN